MLETGPRQRRSLSVPRPGRAHPSPGPPLLRSARRRAGRRRGFRPRSAPVRWTPPCCPRSVCRASLASKSTFGPASAQPPRRSHRNPARTPRAGARRPGCSWGWGRSPRGGGARRGGGAGSRGRTRKEAEPEAEVRSRTRQMLRPGLRRRPRPGATHTPGPCSAARARPARSMARLPLPSVEEQRVAEGAPRPSRGLGRRPRRSPCCDPQRHHCPL